jgi:hypothetical protein
MRGRDHAKGRGHVADFTGPDWEFREFQLPRGTTRQEARRLLTDLAEHDHWELDRLRLWPDGRRRIRLRRRVMRSRTEATQSAVFGVAPA